MRSATAAPPQTHAVDVRHALDSLDYVEMIALAEMFERWALTEEKLTPEHRTRLIQWSCDYEAIARFSGTGWRAADPAQTDGILPFLAAVEARARGPYHGPMRPCQPNPLN